MLERELCSEDRVTSTNLLVRYQSTATLVLQCTDFKALIEAECELFVPSYDYESFQEPITYSTASEERHLRTTFVRSQRPTPAPFAVQGQVEVYDLSA